jgi:hypothetical protein
MEQVEGYIDNDPIQLKKRKIDIETSTYNIKVPFVAVFTGARGSGKSYTLTKLLANLKEEGAINRIFFLCSTYHSNPQYEEVLHPDKDDVYIDIDDSNIFSVLDEIRNKNRADQDAYKTEHEYKIGHRHFCRRKFHRIEDHVAEEIMKRKATEPNEEILKRRPSTCIVLDDMAFTKAFSTSKRNPLTSLVSFHRHEMISLCLVSQAYMAVPKSIRLNATVYFIYPTHNKKEKNLMYEEFGNMLPQKEFNRIFNLATNEKHSFLMITLDPKDNYPSKFRKTFNQFIIVNESEK